MGILTILVYFLLIQQKRRSLLLKYYSILLFWRLLLEVFLKFLIIQWISLLRWLWRCLELGTISCISRLLFRQWKRQNTFYAIKKIPSLHFILFYIFLDCLVNLIFIRLIVIFLEWYDFVDLIFICFIITFLEWFSFVG